MKSIPVLILAGGFGTRLQSVVKDVPKPMAPIQGTPFLEYQIQFLKQQGFLNFIFLTGYKAETIQSHFKDGSQWQVSIRYSHEAEPLGTGGAIAQALNLFSEDTFLVLNGDSFFGLDLSHFLSRAKNLKAALALRYEENVSRYGQVEIDLQENITAFKEKSPQAKDGFINSGVYFIHRSLFQNITHKTFSIEKDVFEIQSQNQTLKGIVCGGPFIDIGLPESYHQAQDLIPFWLKSETRPCLFLDRDGILIQHKHYLHKVEDVEIIPEVVEMIRLAKKKNWFVQVITNQSGVGQGLFWEEDCEKVHLHIEKELQKQNLTIDQWSSCYFHPTKGVGSWKKDSLLRKPFPGMVLKSCDHFRIDLSKSLFIGDNSTDHLHFIDLPTWLIQGDFDLSQRKSTSRYFSSHKEALFAFQDKLK